MSTAAATVSHPPVTTQQPRRTLRSIGAVLTGLVAIGVTSRLGSVAVAVADNDNDNDNDDVDVVVVVDLVGDGDGDAKPPRRYQTVSFSTATDALMRAIGVFPADAKPLQHALVLGAIGVVLSTLGAIAMWHAGTHWYALANIAIPLPAAFIGARLHRARS